MKTYTWGIKIFLDGVYTPDSAIGLYYDDSQGSFRWIETEGIDTTEAYVAGMLERNGFGDIKESFDHQRGGGIVSRNNVSVKVKNVDRLIDTLITSDVDTDCLFIGRRADIYEWVTDGATTTQYTVYTGFCESPEHTETNLIIPIRDGTIKRVANLAYNVDELNYPDSDIKSRGISTPVTFGEYLPDMYVDSNDGTTAIARLPRVSNKKELLYITDICPNVDVLDPLPDSGIYPIVSGSVLVAGGPYEIYGVRGGLTVWDWPAVTYDATNVYMTGIDGTGTGQTRNVSSIGWDSTYEEATIQLSAPFENNLSLISPISWVSFYRVARDYISDSWPCGGFLSRTGQPISRNFDLYSYSNEGRETDSSVVYTNSLDYRLIPNCSFDVNDTSNNKVNIDPMFFDSDMETLKAYSIYPVNINYSTQVADEANLSQWGLGTYSYFRDNLYVLENYYDASFCFAPVLNGNVSNLVDRSITQGFGYQYMLLPSDDINSISSIYKFKLPDIPDNFIFDDVSLIFKCDCTNSRAVYFEPKISVMSRKWIGLPTIDSTTYPGEHVDSTVWTEDYVNLSINNLPDFYLIDQTSNNRYFYYDSYLFDYGFEAKYTAEVHGYKKFKMTGVTRDNYKAITECALMIEAINGTLITDLDVRVSEIAVLFEKEMTIKESIFSYFKGRIFNQAWHEGYEPSSTIRNPQDIIEHCIRLQNWSENQFTPPALGWGHEYGTDPIIDDSTNYGGFLAPTVADITAPCVRQIFDYDDCYTDKIIDSLCKEHFFVQGKRHYTDGTNNVGQEYIVNLFNDSSAVTTLTLADVVGSIGSIKEPNSREIYAEPYVKFRWNPGREDYDRIIAIKNVQNTSWTQANTPGFNAGEGEDYWNRCHDLALRYGVIEKMPSDMAELKWCADYQTAKNYLDKLIKWMQLKRISLTTTYEKGRTLSVADKLNISLPYHTSGVTVSCIIGEIAKSKHKNKVDLVLLMTGYIVAEDYLIQDVFEDGITEVWIDDLISENTQDRM